MGARVEIEYCTKCRWLPRATWMAQELLTTFEQELGEVALVPGEGGVFAIRVDGEQVWSRADDGGGSPDPTAIKRLVRDRDQLSDITRRLTGPWSDVRAALNELHRLADG